MTGRNAKRARKDAPDGFSRREREIMDALYSLGRASAAQILEQIPMHRMGQPDEIARVVSFLAQDASSYITGQIWGVNGGIDM